MNELVRQGFTWDSVRPAVKGYFESLGITTCEIRFHGCTQGNYLGFAHTKKRRHITTLKELVLVVLACNHCHDIIESWGEKRMEEFLLRIIKQRYEHLRTYIVFGRGDRGAITGDDLLQPAGSTILPSSAEGDHPDADR